MGLSVALSNALSGMRTGTNGLDVISRNVANAGVPGYHKQSLSVIEGLGVNSSYVRNGVVTRAFNDSLQQQYSNARATSGFASVRAQFVDRLQIAIGKPGAAGSLDTAYADFQAALSGLSTSPDSHAVRSTVVSSAQTLAQTLNRLSGEVQSLRRETEAKMQNSVEDLNQLLKTLEKVNVSVADHSIDPASRATLADQRDRLVDQIAGIIDVRVDYRNDGSVALMTRSGAGILDGKASVFEFQPAGTLTATAQFSVDSSQSAVGKLTIRTAAGMSFDAVQQNVFKSGEIAALIELRDTTLVTAQNQLDDVAAALAQAMSTIETQGTPVTAGAASGFDVDLAAVRNGNDVLLKYEVGGVERAVRVVRVEDPTKLPMDVTDADGNRVIGLSFAGGAADVAAKLQTALGAGFAVSSTGGTNLRILDNGAGTTAITGLSTRTTVTGSQGQGLGLSLFVDGANADFTNSLEGRGQKLGFAARIAVNADVSSNPALLVQYQAGGSLGDDDRADYLLDRLDTMHFASFRMADQPGSYRLSGNVRDFITQTMDHQGNVAQLATAANTTEQLTLQAVEQRLDSEYGVDVDEEMSRLMQLQNAYAANARVLSTIQELINQLLAI